MNDLGYLDFKSKICLYADDSALSLASDDPISLARDLQQDVNRFKTWTIGNKLTLNAGKTRLQWFVPMSKHRSFIPNLIYCDGIPIQRVDEFKYLGILLDSKLTFEPHAQCLLRRLASSSMLFAKCRYFMSIKAAEIVLKSFLLPIVEHGALFLSLCSDSVVKKVQSHINRLLRIVYKQPPRTANRDLYTRSRVLPLTLRADAPLLRLQSGMRGGGVMTEWMLQPDMLDGSIEQPDMLDGSIESFLRFRGTILQSYKGRPM